MDNDKLEYMKREAYYIEMMGKSIEESFQLFPINWYTNNNYKLKKNVLDEAIQKKCLVEQTELYSNNMMERVVSLKNILKIRKNKERI